LLRVSVVFPWHEQYVKFIGSLRQAMSLHLPFTPEQPGCSNSQKSCGDPQSELFRHSFP